MWRITTTFSGTGVTGGGINRLYFSELTGTAAQAQSAVSTFWNSCRPRMQTGVTINVQATIEVVNEATGQITGTLAGTGTSAAGTNASQPLPLASQARIDTFSGVYIAGRQLKGKIFIPGCTEIDSDNGAPGAAVAATFDPAVAALIADPNSGFGIYSFTHKTWLPAISGKTWNKWAVLRSRRD